MKNKTASVYIRKLPLSKQRVQKGLEPLYHPMPKLYLELIENKDKIKQELVNREHVPPTSLPDSSMSDIPLNTFSEQFKSYLTRPNPETPNPNRSYPLETEERHELNESEESDDMGPHTNYKNQEEYDVEREEDQDTYEIESISDIQDESEEEPFRKPQETQSRVEKFGHLSTSSLNRRIPPPLDTRTTRTYDSDDQSSYSSRNSRDSRESPLPSFSRIQPPRTFGESRTPRESRESRESGKSWEHVNDSTRVPLSDYLSTSHVPTRMGGVGGVPPSHVPSLNELNLHQPIVPDVGRMDHDTSKEDLKRELLFKFDLLRKSYPTIEIEPFSIHSDYEMMKRTYDATIRRVSIDSSVESYKTYLLGGFMVVEYMLGNWAGLDMQGFTQQQIVQMSSYERLLVELGEKSYVDEESQWPVELRLLGLILMNAAVFVVSKLIMKKTGSNLLNMVNSMNQSAHTQAAGASVKKRKMRGPNIDLDHLPDLDEY
jgi:hypothetical protein